MCDSKSDLIDAYSTAHRTHASKVRSAASAVVEGGVSARMMEMKNKTEDINSTKQVRTQQCCFSYRQANKAYFHQSKTRDHPKRSVQPPKGELTRVAAQNRHGAWCFAAGTWRNHAAVPAASHLWGCDPCPSKSPQQQAPHVYGVALWRSAVGTNEWKQ